jgi:DNA-directed RNA polymerase beta subunit
VSFYVSIVEKALRVKESFSKESSLTKRRFFNNRITVSLPDLIEVQKDSYQWFWDKGLKELFSEINPIADFTSKDLELTVTDYYLDEPKYPALDRQEQEYFVRSTAPRQGDSPHEEDRRSKGAGDLPR